MSDVSNITGGPADIHLDDVSHGHTHGGTTATISPQQRMRVVDQFGNSPVDVIHQGDEVRVTTPLPEWSKKTLLATYDPGADETEAAGDKYIGIGRSAGYIYDDRDLKVIPLLAADAGKCAQFYRAVPVGEIQLVHNNEDDRVFNAEYVCLVDEEEDDGELIGKIFLSMAG